MCRPSMEWALVRFCVPTRPQIARTDGAPDVGGPPAEEVVRYAPWPWAEDYRAIRSPSASADSYFYGAVAFVAAAHEPPLINRPCVPLNSVTFPITLPGQLAMMPISLFPAA